MAVEYEPPLNVPSVQEAQFSQSMSCFIDTVVWLSPDKSMKKNDVRVNQMQKTLTVATPTYKPTTA